MAKCEVKTVQVDEGGLFRKPKFNSTVVKPKTFFSRGSVTTNVETKTRGGIDAASAIAAGSGRRKKIWVG